MPGRKGLTLDQMCEALRAYDFAPEVIHAGKAAAKQSEKELVEFKRIIHIYLRSGIPVTLSLSDKTSGHAVTVIGYRDCFERAKSESIKISSVGLTAKLTFINDGYDRLFVHDDQIGPYASASLDIEKGQPEEMDGQPGEQAHQLILSMGLPDGKPSQNYRVKHAVIPLYPKLRCNAKDLLERAHGLLPLIFEGVEGADPALELLFMRSGSYAASLYHRELDPKRILRFQKSLAMSRYIGLGRWYLGKRAVLDTIWDTTDIRRHVGKAQSCEALLAIVALDPAYKQFVDVVANSLGVLPG